MRFGCFLPQAIASNDFTETRNLAEKCEELGFSSIWLFDHMTTFPTVTDEPTLECWTTLSALTQVTKKIRLGTLVTCNSFRHPALLTKMAATVDVLSQGRLDLGIGAGWFEDEYRRFGFDFPSTSSRIKQLEESLTMIKSMWTLPRFTYKGRYYAVTEAFCTPKPVQKPHPPIWVGGKGNKMLRLVAKYGDACNLSSMSPQECVERLRTLNQYCQESGRKAAEMVRSYMAIVLFDKDMDSARAKTRKYIDKLPTSVTGEIDERFYRMRIVGGPEESVNLINDYATSGIDYLILFFPDISHDLLNMFSEKVMTQF